MSTTTILNSEHNGNVAKNLSKYATALEVILEKLCDESDKRIAMLALHGIQAEADRVNSLETIFFIGTNLSEA